MRKVPARTGTSPRPARRCNGEVSTKSVHSSAVLGTAHAGGQTEPVIRGFWGGLGSPTWAQPSGCRPTSGARWSRCSSASLGSCCFRVSCRVNSRQRRQASVHEPMRCSIACNHRARRGTYSSAESLDRSRVHALGPRWAQPLAYDSLADCQLPRSCPTSPMSSAAHCESRCERDCQ